MRRGLDLVIELALVLAVVAFVVRPTEPTLYINPTVLQLPGITRPFIDSLIKISGRPAAIDTLPTSEQGVVRVTDDYQGLTLDITCGWIRNDTVFMNPHLSSYISMMALGGPARHPPPVGTAAGVLAHEFGHLLREKLAGDTAHPIPVWAPEGELFADRFALLILALRADAPRVTNDIILFGYIKERLRS